VRLQTREKSSQKHAPNFIDLTGRVFGRLTVVCRIDSNAQGRACWRCVCTCGAVCVATGIDLRRKHTQSCGCLQREISADRVKHGCCRRNSVSPEWRSWRMMHIRCTNPNANNWAYFGGRGIGICERWSGKNGFVHFLADMGPRRTGTTLDRRDVNGNYTPANCRWATAKQQRQNQRRGEA
jgi:hypothetical protein